MIEKPAPHAANRLGLDYTAEAGTFQKLPVLITDVHSHINGVNAGRIYQRAARLYGVGLTYSMSALENVKPLQEIFGTSMRFIAVPEFAARDKLHAHGKGFLERLEKFHALGVRIVKFWSAPRGIDIGESVGKPDLLRLNASHRIEVMRIASEMGMMFMTHVGDPDTWFQSKYTDSSKYGTKREQYYPLEELLSRFSVPWIAAHMGGWPEDLDFLCGLLERHHNLHLDTSATKWMVRELSKHSRKELLEFLKRWKGRILFGSDIVTSENDLKAKDGISPALAEQRAFDLYASRYWALRTLWERDYEGESPIADPDLALVDPKRSDMDAPLLSGKRIPVDVLQDLYYGAAQGLLEKWHVG